MGQAVGSAEVMLFEEAELPAHTHQVNAVTVTQLSGDHVFPMPVAGSVFTNYQTVKKNKVTAVQAYYSGTQPNVVALSPLVLFPAYDSREPHENRQPYLPIQFCIAANGIFPEPA